MTEITQGDIDLQNELWKTSVNWGNRETTTEIFARHREAAAAEERAKIVAWLMREEDGYPSSEYSGFAAMIREEIEAGEHLK